MKKIKVLHILPDFATGGAEKLAIDICSNLDKNKYDVLMLSLFPYKSTIYDKLLKERNIEVIYLNKKLGIDINVIKELNKVIRYEKPDVIHTHRYASIYTVLATRNSYKGKFIHTVHNIAPKELNKLYRLIMKFGYKVLNIIPVAISDIIKESIINEYKLDRNSVPCIYNGIDTKNFIPNTNIRNSNYITLINVARFQQQKNHKLLIDAFREVASCIDDIKLKLVGDGELKEEIVEMVNHYNIQNKVEFKGIVSDVKSELSNSDIFVLSSDWEGLPISVLEAMACGLPIVSTNSGGTEDIVKNKLNGIIVDIGSKEDLKNAIIELCKNPVLRKKMGDKSLEYSKKFDITNTTKQYENLYNYILNNLK